MHNLVLTEDAGFDIAGAFLDASKGLSGETISSLMIVGILCLLSFYIAIRAHFQDPLKKPKGILLLAEIGVKFFDDLVESLMGKYYRGFGGFILAIACYLFISFIWGLTGLPSPVTYLATPLSLGLITFVLIHANAIRFNKFKYFKRYVDPLPFFLPINLISMWAPLLSLTMRLFGNALAGWTLMTLVYGALGSIGNVIFEAAGQSMKLGGAIAPIITPALHAYFDLFSGLIQTVVFLFLSMIFIANEGPEDDIDELSMKGGN
ncbi:MAG: F0F1 ATP synthase subunit A [Bacilli bacterium]|nr:F0F1 ATP synthase subunit A [Bacilli bacterium]